jgi:hypothetical protein
MTVKMLLLCCLWLPLVVKAWRLCDNCWEREIFTQPAVGIEFGLDYGWVHDRASTESLSRITISNVFRVAILKYPNDTVVPLARVEGDANYVSAMLEILQETQTLDSKIQYKKIGTEEGSQVTALRPRSPKSLFDSRLLRSLPNTTYRDHIQERQIVQSSENSDTPYNAFHTMAQLLSHHIKQVLQDQIAFLGVATPTFFNKTHQERLQVAVSKAGLRSSIGYFQTGSAIAAIVANGIGVCGCPQSPASCAEDQQFLQEMSLTIEYTEALLTIYLFERIGSFIPGDWHNGGILYTLPRISGRSDSSSQQRWESFWKTVISKVKAIVAETPEKRIDQIVLAGSLANDTELHQAIQSALGIEISQPQLTPDASERYLAHPAALEKAMADPVIAVAQGVADLAWRSAMKGCLDPCSQWRELPCKLGEAGSRLSLWEMFTIDEEDD